MRHSTSLSVLCMLLPARRRSVRVTFTWRVLFHRFFCNGITLTCGRLRSRSARTLRESLLGKNLKRWRHWHAEFFALVSCLLPVTRVVMALSLEKARASLLFILGSLLQGRLRRQALEARQTKCLGVEERRKPQVLTTGPSACCPPCPCTP